MTIYKNIIIVPEEINDIAAKSIIEGLYDYPNPHLYIDSNGGSLAAGLAIVEVMINLRRQKRIATINYGMAGSIAALIFASGTYGERHIDRHARIYLHNAYIGQDSTLSESDQLQMLELQSARLEKLWLPYGLDAQSPQWIDPKTAISYNLCDKVI